MKGLKQKIDKIKPKFDKGGKYEKFHSVFDGFYTFLFTPNETSRSGVHIHDSNDSKRTMIMVVIALLPCCLFGMWNIGLQHFLAIGSPERNLFSLFFYGFWAVLPQILTAYIVGLGIEFVVAQIRGHEIQEGFLVSGILIPMICPVDTPCWMLAIAVAFAVIFAKEVFGGTGYNFLNVALVTRAFLFFSYPAKMSGDNVFVSLGGLQAVDAYSGATPLGQMAAAGTPDATVFGVTGDPLSMSDIFFGLYPGSWGETSTPHPHRRPHTAAHRHLKLAHRDILAYRRIPDVACGPQLGKPALSLHISSPAGADVPRRLHVRSDVHGH